MRFFLCFEEIIVQLRSATVVCEVVSLITTLTAEAGQSTTLT